MKLCVFGAGAIGGLMAAKLAAQGDVAVTVIARGPHLAAMQAKGLVLRSEGSESVIPVRAVASAEEAGVQDYVVITLKAHSLPSAAPQMQALLGPETAVVSAVNVSIVSSVGPGFTATRRAVSVTFSSWANISVASP